MKTKCAYIFCRLCDKQFHKCDGVYNKHHRTTICKKCFKNISDSIKCLNCKSVLCVECFINQERKTPFLCESCCIFCRNCQKFIDFKDQKRCRKCSKVFCPCKACPCENKN